MANDDQLKILSQGSQVWNAWREEHPSETIDFHGADLRFKNLRGANLRDAHLGNTILGEANLQRADLRRANLSFSDVVYAQFQGANLSFADLQSANLTTTNLRDANLFGANARFTNFSLACLAGANFSGTRCGETIFANLDLSEARSLDLVEHEGPSTVGVDTLLLSGDRIPNAFLEGCGVPDQWIDYLPSLIGKPFDFYSCFISYSHKDEEFCKQLYSRMRTDNLRVWFAPEDMQGGKKIHEQIDYAIKIHEKLLIVLTENSMKSEWVKTEIRHARKREVDEGRRILFPIRLVSFELIRNWTAFDADTGKDMAAEIREYFIQDFTNWKDHDSFQSAYDRLMEDFKPTAND